MAKRRKQFSHVISKVSFDGRVLEVKGRMRLAWILLLAMTAAMVGGAVLAEKAPIFVRILMGLGALLTGYGVVDTLFGESYLRFDLDTRRVQIRKGNPFGKVAFDGRADALQKLYVSRIRAGKGPAQVQLYTIVLAATFPEAFVNFPLEMASYPEAAADKKVAEWEQKLRLAAPVPDETAAAVPTFTRS